LVIVTCLLQTVEIYSTCKTRSIMQSLRNSQNLGCGSLDATNASKHKSTNQKMLQSIRSVKWTAALKNTESIAHLT